MDVLAIKKLGSALRLWLCVGLMGLLVGCLGSDSGQESGTDLELINLNELVCNPFGGDTGDRIRTQGVHGKIYYAHPDDEFHMVQDYFDFGVLVDELELFINQIFVPTRPFDRPFTTQSGHTVTTVEGDNLYEWFALKLDGSLVSGEAPPGEYQLALLADDGAVMRIDRGNGMELYIDNDGTHPTRMACAEEPVTLGPTPMHFEIDYYQGPRYHISLVLMMRAWTGDADDPECGKEGNSRFWDSTQDPPQPQAAFFGLESRGWEVLSESNYKLIEPFDRNPCNDPAPTIVNFGTLSIGLDNAVVRWTTDVPSTTQVQYTNLLTSEVFTTTLDLGLVTTHTVSFSGLSANTPYEVIARSSSSSGLSTDSEPIIVRTRR